MFVRCIVCSKVIKPAIVSPDPQEAWFAAGEAVIFDGGSGYGSGMFDALVDGVLVRVVICDDCLKEALKIGRAIRYKLGRHDTEIILEDKDNRNG